MGHIREAAHINAPIERVWEFLVDYRRWPEWQTNVVEVEERGGVPGEVGFTYLGVYKALGRRLETHSEITRSERPRLIEEKGTMPGGGQMTMLSTLEPAPDGGTNLEFMLDYELGSGFLAGVADKLVFERSIERDTRHSTENLIALIESEAPVSV